ncbi:MAG: 50S ribosomal protein L5 [Planctomycetes bacterium]|nr:50S ribosomal protein L5 [Planctomycetota bacterium]
MMDRLSERYNKEVVPAVIKQFNYKSRWEVPRLDKIVVNMGVGKATEEKDRMEAAVKDLAAITGQKPIVTRARVSVDGFKLRKNEPIGCKVTLRGRRMFEFLDRVISIVLPRQKDFRGLSRKSFDKQGNFNMGIAEQSTFPEINIDNVQFVQGMDITIVINNKGTDASYTVLKTLGMPFRD